MKKADCTPEEWEVYRRYHREHYAKNREKVLARVKRENLPPEKLAQVNARQREYYRRPEVKARRALIDARPERRAKRREYAQNDAAKLRAKHRLNERLASNPGLRDYRRNYGRLLRTGFTYDLMEQCLALQGHACAVCRRPFTEENKGHADHCHDTNTPRGVLCFQCNIIEGKLRTIGLSAVEFGRRMHEYLENPPVGNLTKVD